MILIDNMEIPNNCAECNFWSICPALSESEYPDYESIITNEIIGENGKRHQNCPLHEVADSDTVSRPQGHWIRVPVANGLDKYRCDKCGHYVTSGEDKNFCPNCGNAKTRSFLH